MPKTQNPNDFIPLRPVEFEILLVLTAGDSHGYGIIKEAEERSEGRTRIETGTLYRALRRLTEAGLVEPSTRRAVSDLDDERRRYFAITEFGNEVAAVEARRLAAQVDAARARELLTDLQAGGVES